MPRERQEGPSLDTGHAGCAYDAWETPPAPALGSPAVVSQGLSSLLLSRRRQHREEGCGHSLSCPWVPGRGLAHGEVGEFAGIPAHSAQGLGGQRDSGAGETGGEARLVTRPGKATDLPKCKT